MRIYDVYKGCPQCGNRQTVRNGSRPMASDPSKMVQKKKCPECGLKWMERYKAQRKEAGR